jgi:hypothetical protein
VRTHIWELMNAPINLVKVFTATKAKDRESIGERVTDWIAANPIVHIVKTVVALSSDRTFHCLSVILFCSVGERLRPGGAA